MYVYEGHGSDGHIDAVEIMNPHCAVMKRVAQSAGFGERVATFERPQVEEKVQNYL
jgi:hypothetical protein